MAWSACDSQMMTRVRWHVSETKGRRARMEDRHAVVETEANGVLACVFDGHGGDGVAERMRRDFPRAFLSALAAEPSPEQAF